MMTIDALPLFAVSAKTSGEIFEKISAGWLPAEDVQAIVASKMPDKERAKAIATRVLKKPLPALWFIVRRRTTPMARYWRK
jgi:hypothetical protein